MYYEVGEFVSKVARDRVLWKDGEFWTALAIGLGVVVWCHYDSAAIIGIRLHFGDLLSATSIVFGFVLTTLFFYVQAAAAWADDPKVKGVAIRLVDWHVWTIFSLLVLVGYILVLWSFARPDWWPKWILVICYGILGFLVSYSGFQIVNHTLTVRWIFRRRHRLHTISPKTTDNDLEEQRESQH
jgi:hypothetical protein